VQDAGPATASGAWGRREICAAGSIAYAARHAVARRAKAGRWADDAVARVVELVREDSLQAAGRYTDVKNAIGDGDWGLELALTPAGDDSRGGESKDCCGPTFFQH